MGVGELLGKLFGADTSKAQASLRAYGKLPMYPEYRRLEVSPGLPIAFSQWMDAGRLAWVRSESKSERGVTYPARVMVRVPDHKEIVVANIWDSRDSLGRVFPFAMFVVCSADMLGREPIAQWSSADAIHKALDQFHGELRTLSAGGDFSRFYHNRSVPLRGVDPAEKVSALQAAAADVDAEAWFAGLGLDSTVSLASWAAGLLRRAERWQAEQETLPNLALNCPLARGIAYDVQAAMWLEWLQPICKRHGKRLSLISAAEQQGGPARLTLLIRDILADDFQLITSDHLAYGYVEHLGNVPNGGDVPDGFVAPSGSLLEWFRSNALSL